MTSAQLPRKSKEPPVHLYLQVFLLIPSSYCVVSDSWRWNPEKNPDFIPQIPLFLVIFGAKNSEKRGDNPPIIPPRMPAGGGVPDVRRWFDISTMSPTVIGVMHTNFITFNQNQL